MQTITLTPYDVISEADKAAAWDLPRHPELERQSLTHEQITEVALREIASGRIVVRYVEARAYRGAPRTVISVVERASGDGWALIVDNEGPSWTTYIAPTREQAEAACRWIVGSGSGFNW